MKGADFESFADKMRVAYWGKDKCGAWNDTTPNTQEAWLRVADVAYSIIQTTVAHARPTEKTTKMRHALWAIIEEAQAALKAD